MDNIQIPNSDLEILTSQNPLQANALDSGLIDATNAFGNNFGDFFDNFPYFIFQIPFKPIHLIFDYITQENLFQEIASLISTFESIENLIAIEQNSSYPTHPWVKELIRNSEEYHMWIFKKSESESDQEKAILSQEKIIPSLLMIIYTELFAKKNKRHLLTRFEDLSYCRYLSDSYSIFRIENFDEIFSYFSFKEDCSMKLFRFFFFMNFLVKYRSWIISTEKLKERKYNKHIRPSLAWENFFREELTELNNDILFFIFSACQLTMTTFALRNIQALVSTNPNIAYKDKCFFDLLIACIAERALVHPMSVCLEMFEDSITSHVFCQLLFSHDIPVIECNSLFYFRAIIDNALLMEKIINYVCTAIHVKERQVTSFSSYLQLHVPDTTNKPSCKKIFILEFFKLFEQKKDIPTISNKNTRKLISPFNFSTSTSEIEIRKIGKKILFAVSIAHETPEVQDMLLSLINESAKGILFDDKKTEEIEPGKRALGENVLKFDREFLLKIHCNMMIIQFKFTVQCVKICFIVINGGERTSEVMARIINGYKDFNNASFELIFQEKRISHIDYSKFKGLIRYFSKVTVDFIDEGKCNQKSLKQISDVLVHAQVPVQINSTVKFSYHPQFQAVHMACSSKKELKKSCSKYSYYFEMLRRLLSEVNLNYLCIDLCILLQPGLVDSQLTSSHLIKNINEVFVNYFPTRIFNENYTTFFQVLKLNSIKLTLIQQKIHHRYQREDYSAKENKMLTSLEFPSLDLISLRTNQNLSDLNSFLSSKTRLRNVSIYHYKVKALSFSQAMNARKNEFRSTNVVDNFCKDIFLYRYDIYNPLGREIKRSNLMDLFPHIKLKTVTMYDSIKSWEGAKKNDELYFFLYCQTRQYPRLKKNVICLVAQFLEKRFQLEEYVPRINF